MGYILRIRKFQDSDISEFYTKESEIIEFLKNLKKYKFASIYGKSISENIDNISVFQILEINFDFKDEKGEYHISVETEEGGEEVINLKEFGEDFFPTYEDKTDYYVLRFYFKKKKIEKGTSIKEVIYNLNSKKLFFGEHEFYIGGGSSYMLLPRYIIENQNKELHLSELSEYHHGIDELDEKLLKSTRNGLDYFYTLTKEMMNGKRLFQTDNSGKFILNFPIKIIKDSE